MNYLQSKTVLFKLTSSGLAVQKLLFSILFVSSVIMLLSACKQKSLAEAEAEKLAESVPKLPDPEPPIAKIPVTKEISAGRFFQFMEKVIRQYDTLSLYPLSENLLLRANPWILDTLVNTDYYYQMSLGNFVYDLKKMRILKPGDTLLIPGPKTAATLLQKIVNTRLDINIPAFELSILEGDSLLYSIPVRVGKDQKKYLESAGRRVDLRTRTGTGEIIRVNRFPSFVNPVDGKKFKFTKRDDHQTTLMPQIPWLEPAINGQRLGQMIHPTTNPRSLGKPASNGCIGVNEANAWRIYFFAPVGTKVTIRYDLEEINAEGDTVRYEDIYRLRKTGKSAEAVPVAGIYRGQPEVICICDSIF